MVISSDNVTINKQEAYMLIGVSLTDEDVQVEMTSLFTH
jgi:hypothetical protein